MMIAERKLLLVEHGGQSIVTVKILLPRQNQMDWSCSFEIHWPTGRESGSAYGIDSAQALILCIQLVASAIYASDYHKAGLLRWDREGGGYGFPLPSILADMAIGDDKRLFLAGA